MTTSTSTGAAPERPRIEFPADLPISAHTQEIAQLIREHQVVVVAGETGSGKTTQLPKICLLAGREHIGHTQPRRIAARSVAERIAQEMGVELGDLVGYQVRFTRQAGKQTRVKVMTDGILLAEIGHDRDLRRYDTIIIDEAHERSLNIDFLLGYLKQLLPRRPELRVIITSATIDTARFSEHFDNAPVVEVSGRSFPVEVRYLPLSDPDKPDQDGIEQPEGIVRACAELRREGPGDILVFCSGEREIRDGLTALEAENWPNTQIVPLHARLSASEQHRIFTSHPGRRIVLATNIAETSLTVPGIRYVVDAGTARISRYSARTKVQRLPIEPISQASANQRAGRCGRVAPGIAIRLYSEDDYLSRPQFTEPEILRTNLASVILQMAKARLGDISKFPFVEAPDAAQITDGLRLLTELGALKQKAPVRLTKVGRELSELPIDPRLGRMLIEADQRGCLREVLVIVAFLAIQDPRERPSEKREQADQLHARFFSDDALAASTGQPLALSENASVGTRANSLSASGRQGGGRDQGPARFTPHTSKTARYQGLRGESAAQPGAGGVAADAGGDIIAIVRLWRYLKARRQELSGNQFRRLCRDEYLNYLRVREWQDIHTQLKLACKDLGLQRNQSEAATPEILTAVLAGLISHIGLQLPPPERNPKTRGRRPVTEFLGTRGSRFAIQPGSALAKKPPQLVMAVELVETTRLWARMVAAIEPEWIEQVGSHLLKRSYSEPHWSSNSDSVVAYEKVMLLGVPIIAERLVDYAHIDQQQARQIFIRAGLVEEQWNPRDAAGTRGGGGRDVKYAGANRDTAKRNFAAGTRGGVEVPSAEVPSPGRKKGRVASSSDKKMAARGSNTLDHRFLQHNRQVLRDAEEVADRVRGQGILIDDQLIFDFYDSRLPSDITSAATFDKWWRSYPDKSFLEFDLDLLTEADDRDSVFNDFPDRWQIAGLELPVSYVFEPGAGRDGASVSVKLAQLNQLDPEPFSWQVPGLRTELATELIRHLPKRVRTNFVPAPDHAREALAWLESHDADHSRPFCLELGRALRALTGAVVDPDDWAPDQVPTHLQVGFQVSVPGKPDRFSRDLTELRHELSAQVSKTLTKAAPKVEQSTSWTFGTLQPKVSIKRSGITAIGYPALKDMGQAVGQIIAETPTQQQASHRKAIRRLLVLTNPDPTRWTVSHLTQTEKLALPSSPYANVPALLADARLKAVEQCAARHTDTATIRDQPGYEKLALEVRQEQADQMRQVTAVAAQVCELTRQVRTQLASSMIGGEITEQLDNLVFDGFIGFIRDPWYDRLPAYLKAMIARMQQAATDPTRDARLAEPIDQLLAEYDELCNQQPSGPLPETVDDIGFWIEELRVQTWAQRLGTVVTVSPKRIRKAMQQAREHAAARG
ncbi:ATP-dependent RNA helicase HrpA [Propionimicrobium sp. PCR01-08-3]|uniref:ATP-dependent RNA helicase HrpA n=1 Tax=Propionimicrobium sp. PCR01-08-3 TaxID=3052086 RepID=UPI00255CE13B|nr:ATP-dependent RNA helicase HrpA [Propionimicrobium sp. PCR01-08-3]WIY83678.1 ATP-dependent RNA helicase HrpA [Propionimicrobium sp. PCR01-08-3]